MRLTVCLGAALLVLQAGGAAAQSVSPIKKSGVTPTNRKAFYVTIRNPYPAPMTFSLTPMEPDFEKEAKGTKVLPDTVTLGQDRQRRVFAAPIFAESASGGGTNTENITGKMIVMDTLMDSKAFPWQADWYRTQVKKSLGNQFNDQYRLYYSDHADP